MLENGKQREGVTIYEGILREFFDFLLISFSLRKYVGGVF